MPPSFTKRLVYSAKIALVVIILSYLFYDISKKDQLQTLINGPKQWTWVSLGCLASLLALLLGFVRWRIMVQALGLPFTLLDSIRIGLIGLFFGLFAFGVLGGDALRAFYVTRQVKDRVSEAVTSVLADRIIGLLTMFIIASTAFLFFDPSSLEASGKANALMLVGWIVVGCTMLGLGGLVLLYFTPQITSTLLYHRVASLPKVGTILNKVMAAIRLYRQRPGTIAIAFLLSAGVNLFFAISIYALATGLTEGNPTFLNHFVIEPIAMVSNAVPVPGGIGTMEMAMKYLYLAFGSENGVITGFAFRFALLLVSALGGLVWFLNREQVEVIEELQESFSEAEEPAVN